MIIRHNAMALTAYRHYQQNSFLMQRSMERLSSGQRINRAADDPAGLAISEKMRAQIRGLEQAARNARDGISVLQTAEGALSETQAILQRMRELAVQAANDTNTDREREAIAKELEQLRAAIDSIGNSTEFNTIKLLDGSGDGKNVSLSLQIGANSGQTMQIKFNDMRAGALGLDEEDALDVSSHEKAQEVIERLETAVRQVSSERARIGAYQNRLEHTISNVTNSAVNLQAAESRIRDADMAREMMEYTKRSLLAQVALAMIAQANQQSHIVLRLLQ
ncbi:flagellin [Alkalihalobacillus oceani]|uniref:flagellin N-terminal helical domain-containing protein n=1 Tax=Halalkalibacter oceani TaxID=1653776 RepID=UPI00203E57EB|nr:flagellin [Halalkalibacter oceani]MCM3760675.1 flagellin [Halalkalibacter oceani]